MPHELVTGKVSKIITGEDGDGNYIDYIINYNANSALYSTVANLRPTTDNIKSGVGTEVKVRVSKILPNVAMPNNIKLIVMTSFIFLFFFFFNFILIYQKWKNPKWLENIIKK